MDTAYFREKITTTANAAGLNPLFVEGICWIESRGRADAFRYEPMFWQRYRLWENPLYKGQNPRRVSSSYGLMQIMYPVAVELGFAGEPEQLFLIATNLFWGCKKLRTLQEWAANFDVKPTERLRAMAAAYNGGKGGNAPGSQLRNGTYADKVLAAMNVIAAPPVIHA